jgi:hypothetical protein
MVKHGNRYRRTLREYVKELRFSHKMAHLCGIRIETSCCG